MNATVDSNALGIGAALMLASDGHFDLADASSSTTMPCRALALETGTGSKLVLLDGFIRNDSWSWTPGASLFVHVTTGALSASPAGGDETAGNIVQIVGYALTATIIRFAPSLNYAELGA
jgi:hypothetical protein